MELVLRRFPAGYVEPLDGQPSARLETLPEESAVENTSSAFVAAASGEEWTVALYAFESQEPGDLAFDVGVSLSLA